MFVTRHQLSIGWSLPDKIGSLVLQSQPTLPVFSVNSIPSYRKLIKEGNKASLERLGVTVWFVFFNVGFCPQPPPPCPCRVELWVSSISLSSLMLGHHLSSCWLRYT